MLRVHFKNGETTTIEETIEWFVKIVEKLEDNRTPIFVWDVDKLISVNDILYIEEIDKKGRK